MVCGEKERLKDKHTTATASLRAALHGIQWKTGDELTQALESSAEAAYVCSKAHEALANHKDRHCLRRPSAV